MSYFAVLYDVVDDFPAQRARYREEHLKLARESRERGELVLGGAFADPVDQALLVFRAPDVATVERFIRADPYVRHGLVTRWRIRPWSVAVE